jgi:hypothetical protein
LSDEPRTPTRIRLQRTKGWRKPATAVVVARPSRWGNPFRIGVDGDRIECRDQFRAALLRGELAISVVDVRRELGGRDLACWCNEGEACHADVLHEIANAEARTVTAVVDDERRTT